MIGGDLLPNLLTVLAVGVAPWALLALLVGPFEELAKRRAAARRERERRAGWARYRGPR